MGGSAGTFPLRSDAADATWRAAADPPRGARVVIGVSGGVDSAVAAALLRERGCDVVGVSTKNFCLGPGGLDVAEGGSCCSEDALAAAAELCADLGISHTVLDVVDAFSAHVIDDWTGELRSGRTPSPCVACNTRVRFPSLWRFARQVGADWVASGHYARRVCSRDEHFVARGRDPVKDQSYFLYRLPDDILRHLTFPLAEMTKEQVRDTARRRGLPVAETPDSQELCFVPDGDRRRILRRGAGRGELIDRHGAVLGYHDGVEFFTVGQRRGLGLGGPHARYVVSIDATRNRVVVGCRSDLEHTRLRCIDVVDRDPRPDAPGLVARTRHRHPGIEVAALRRDGSAWNVTLASADVAPAPGQALVLYREGVAVGGGRLA